LHLCGVDEKISSTEIKTILKTVHQFVGAKLKVMNVLRNRVQLIGKLGTAPEVKTFEGGRKLAKFSMATNETYRNSKGEKVEETQWHRLIAWGKVAEIAEKYLAKGTEVAIEGKLVNNNYIDKDGNKMYGSEVVVNELLLIGAKASA
jgi:single-strand DNA-binding protein